MVLADGVESAFSEWLLSLQMPLEHWPIPRVIPIWAVVSWPHSQLASCRRLVNRDTTWPEWGWQVLLRLLIWWWLVNASIRFCHITWRGIWFWIKAGHALQQKRKDEPKEWTVECSSVQSISLQFCAIVRYNMFCQLFFEMYSFLPSYAIWRFKMENHTEEFWVLSLWCSIWVRSTDLISPRVPSNSIYKLKVSWG